MRARSKRQHLPLLRKIHRWCVTNFWPSRRSPEDCKADVSHFADLKWRQTTEVIIGFFRSPFRGDGNWKNTRTQHGKNKKRKCCPDNRFEKPVKKRTVGSG